MLAKLGLVALTFALALVFAFVYQAGRGGLASYLQTHPAGPLIGPGTLVRQRLEGIAGALPPADDGIALRDRGLTALRRARASADPTYYDQAERVLQGALK